MKNRFLFIAVLAVFGLYYCFKSRVGALEAGTYQTEEYVTIRWAGRENTHLIRSNGKVEFLYTIFGRTPRPDRVDERAFYMNIAMNAVAKEGYVFAGMNNDEIVMKRSVAR